jgi:tripartite-type tricarboxylate transporter receptor subunit TctC
VCFPPAPTVPSYANSGRIRPLAIGAPKRWAQMPNLPTLEEAGLKGYELSPWFGLWYPAGTPAEYVTRIQTEVAKVVRDPAVAKNLAEQGMEGAGSTPPEFEKTIADELVFFKKLTTRMGVVPQ